MGYEQAPPYCVQIEFTEGCNLRCSFCGINGIRGKEHNFKFMSEDVAQRIADQMKEHAWNSRIEFAMHGEPTMNPVHAKLVRRFRKTLPKAYMLMESNGGGLMRDPYGSVKALFDAGLNTLALDEYQNIKLVPKIWEAILETTYIGDIFGTDVDVHNYPQDGPVGNPHQRGRRRRLIRVHPIDLATNGTHSSLSNHCGAGLPHNDRAEGKRCAKPFRELSFRWDGSVAVCCNDWRGVMPVGNIMDMDLPEIWHHPRMEAMRRRLYHGQRDVGACRGCDYTSYRVGLLPDHKGAVELPEPEDSDDKIIQEMLDAGPLTPPVWREWEK